MGKTKLAGFAALAALCAFGSNLALAHGSGINRSEAARLRYQYHELQHMKRAAWADGAVTRREAARIHYQEHKLRRLVNIARNN
jgi:hypothetical protein